MDKGLTKTKMGADKLFKNTPNTPKFICPNCLPKPKSLGFFMKKGFIGHPQSVVVAKRPCIAFQPLYGTTIFLPFPACNSNLDLILYYTQVYYVPVPRKTRLLSQVCIRTFFSSELFNDHRKWERCSGQFYVRRQRDQVLFIIWSSENCGFKLTSTWFNLRLAFNIISLEVSAEKEIHLLLIHKKFKLR